MTEPEYHYVKGKGWVIVTGHPFSVKGKNYLVVQRKPRYGEIFGHLNPKYDNSNPEWWNSDGTVKVSRLIESFIDNFSSNYYQRFNERLEGLIETSNYTPLWFTIEEL